ncbi:transcription elongation factor GreA [Ureaplasma ceti]|uniref:Transcription elongation factor GreA n=1 Tax=Ureaplasma ceti TaxID=3119530 RepID=A0ABP9UBI6_9BACT
MAINEKELLTQEDYDKLREQLDDLKNNVLPEIIKQLQEARAQGDLSENADYSAAKEEQGRISEQIRVITEKLDNAQIISEDAIDTSKVSIGTKVTIHDYDDDKEYTFTIVGSEGSDPEQWKISNDSPLGKSILGLTVGATVEVKGIEKPYKVKVKKISKK